jgi:hypothetical protein
MLRSRWWDSDKTVILPSGKTATAWFCPKQSTVLSKSFALLRVLVSTGSTPTAANIRPMIGILKNRASAQKCSCLLCGTYKESVEQVIKHFFAKNIGCLLVTIRTAGSKTIFR